ncbi:MAG: ATP-grasp domain-containing protein [Deltaproteobacteria bacterium]|nr:ATP-grasp domain-containing protein [Deltaproteobacteria bacterium]MCL4873260.1 ATP-grasp domain-containing protein [bacterium]
MTPARVKIIFNDDGSDTYTLGEKTVDLDNILTTVSDVEGALRSKGYETARVPLRRREDLERFTKEIRDPEEVIFNLCEGAFNRSSLEMHVAALLELHGARFTGSGPLTLGLALDKGLTKDILSRRGVPTPGYAVMTEASGKTGEIEFPLIVKPLREDASIGIDSGAVVESPSELKERVEHIISTYAQPAIVEEYVDGREFNIAVMGNGKSRRALPPSEILFVDFPEGKPKICCYEAKWVEESPFYRKTVPSCPAEIPEKLKGELQAVALKAYGMMGCRDYARVDMRLGKDGKAKVLEVNPNPDISSDAGFARAAKAAGLDYPDLIAAIVDAAVSRYTPQAGTVSART